MSNYYNERAPNYYDNEKYCENNEYKNYLIKTGHTGPIGPIGSAGKMGDTGANGVQGATGKRGKEGEQGTRGIHGFNGFPGAPGLPGAPGSPGLPGIQGLQGAPGNPGATGLQGSVGQNGATGSRGINGSNGVQGNQGTQGAPGAPGAHGTPGAPGAPGVPGVPGALGAPGTKGLRGEKGDPGAMGVIGNNGPTGSDGPIGPINNLCLSLNNYLFAYTNPDMVQPYYGSQIDIRFDVFDLKNGWTSTDGGINFICHQNGLYRITYSMTVSITNDGMADPDPILIQFYKNNSVSEISQTSSWATLSSSTVVVDLPPINYIGIAESIIVSNNVLISLVNSDSIKIRLNAKFYPVVLIGNTEGPSTLYAGLVAAKLVIIQLTNFAP